MIIYKHKSLERDFNMKTYAKKLLLTTTMALTLGLISHTASATDVSIPATVTTRAAVSFGTPTAIDFGTIDYATTHTGSITVSTAGVGSFNSPVGVSQSGTPAAGSVSVTGDGVSVIQISCGTTGTLSDGTNTLALTAVLVKFNATADTTCAGLGTTPDSRTLTGTDSIKIGGTLALGTIASNNVYNTTKASGVPVTLRVIY